MLRYAALSPLNFAKLIFSEILVLLRCSLLWDLPLNAGFDSHLCFASPLLVFLIIACSKPAFPPFWRKQLRWIFSIYLCVTAF